MARRSSVAVKPPVTSEQIDRCFAHTVATGDIINFRFLFVPFSPLRDGTTENIATPKYAYLLPADESDPRYQDALSLVTEESIARQIRNELKKDGPAQMPWQPLLRLADNAVELGKYRAAAQAYELLRIREGMQDRFFSLGDEAIDRDDMPRAVRAYRVALGLAYDYAAFPEPLPAAPNYPSRALLLHAEYPQRPEQAVAVQPAERHVQIALNYLLLGSDRGERLAPRPVDVKMQFVREWIHQTDPDWPTFVARFHDACNLVREIGARIEANKNRDEGAELAEEVESQQREDPATIPATLLGRTLEDGEWWQYLKELAYSHPAAALFVRRQAMPNETEIIMPTLPAGSPFIEKLGLEAG